MSKSELEEMLTTNGFTFHPPLNDDDTLSSHVEHLIIENIGISKVYQQIAHVEVVYRPNPDDFIIHIFFKDGRVNRSDSPIDMSMYDFRDVIPIYDMFDEFLSLGIVDKNDFIKELYRLNSTGLNIKG